MVLLSGTLYFELLLSCIVIIYTVSDNAGPESSLAT